MKTLFKVLLGLVALVVIVVAGAIIYISSAYPDVGDAPDITVEATPERVARGEYLAMHVSMCVDCHSERDYTRFAAPVADGTHGKGGELFGENIGLPGNFYAANLTPAGIGDRTDGELYRAITAGVGRDGRALFPIMPYPHFGKMAREDVYAIIAFLRTLAPIENSVPASEASFPMNIIMRTIPQKSEHAPSVPDPAISSPTGHT
jgi:mono/diheme cytochrome c family protein